MTAALLALSLLAAAPTAGPTFIENDYAKALATAKREKKLLFVDAWAPWCHTCIYMREHVLNTPAFAPFGKQLVFASVDTERTASAAFLEKFPVDVWPTLFFIDPATEKLVFKWVGSADAEQMKALLAAARRSNAKVSEADALLAEGNEREAAARYLAALQAGAGDATARATLSMLSALSSAKGFDVCATTAAEQAPKLAGVSDRINAISWGLGCALELDPKAAGRDALVATLVAQAKAGVKLEGAMGDDVSGLFDLLVQERKAAKDPAAAEAVAKDWLAYLEGLAAKAKTPAARAVFDPHRVGAALEARQPARVEAALLQSEKDLPADYNPPARLAVVYRELGRLDDAVAAIDRALAKCGEGPRKLRLFDTKADLLERKGDLAGRQQALDEALAWAKKLPRSQLSEKRLDAIEARARAGSKAPAR